MRAVCVRQAGQNPDNRRAGILLLCVSRRHNKKKKKQARPRTTGVQASSAEPPPQKPGGLGAARTVAEGGPRMRIDKAAAARCSPKPQTLNPRP